MKNQSIRNRRVALIFGGKSPIALASARILSKTQRVILVSSSINESIMKEIKDSPEITLIEADIGIPNNCKSIVEKIYLDGLEINIIIFLQRYRPRGKPEFSSHVSIELWCIKETLESIQSLKLVTEPVHVLVATSPAASTVLLDQDLNYHLIKSAQEALVRYFAANLRKDNISVNSIRIGSLVLKERASNYWSSIPNTLTEIKRLSPSGNVLTSETVAAIISRLALCFNPGISGQVYSIDDGFSLRDQSQLIKTSLEPFEEYLHRKSID